MRSFLLVRFLDPGGGEKKTKSDQTVSQTHATWTTQRRLERKEIGLEPSFRWARGGALSATLGHPRPRAEFRSYRDARVIARQLPLTLSWSQHWHTVEDLLGHGIHGRVALLGNVVEGKLSSWSLNLLHPVALGSIGVSPSVRQTLHHLADLSSMRRRCLPRTALRSLASLSHLRTPPLFSFSNPVFFSLV